MTLEAFVSLLWRRRLLVVVLTALGMAGGNLVTNLVPRVFTASAINFVTAVPAPAKGASYETAQFAVSRAKSYSPLLRSPTVLSGVIDELKLDMPPDELSKQISAENPVDTLLINITAKASTADLARRVANSAARHLATEIEHLETGGKNRESPIDVQLAVPATAPSAPSEPRPLVNAVLGALVGFVSGALAALALRHRGSADPRARRDLRVRWMRRRSLMATTAPPESSAPPRTFTSK